MKKYPKVSIIIPLYVIIPRFFDDLKEFQKLNYPSYEIIIVSDKQVKFDDPKIKLLKTGKRRTGPAEKRDLGIKVARGEICAFIDDDAYPDADWLKNAVKHFRDERIAAVGGPGLTPPEDPFWAQVTGVIYKSYFCGGRIQHRFVKMKRRFFVTDYPAYNLLIRKRVLKEVGGYGSYFYGGEDTFLCLKIIQKGYRILYDPNVVVYHHRRPLVLPYLKQIANIGVHRGFFAKRYPETSRALTYFWPTILTVGFVIGLVASLFSLIYFTLFIFLFLIVYTLAVLSVIKKSDPIKSLIAGFGIIATHLTYGTFFIKGLLTNELTR